jgi:hypothetical protein
LLPRVVRPRPVSLLIALASVLVACGSSAASPATTPGPAGSPSAAAAASPSGQRVTVAEKGFGLTLPDGWERLPLDQAGLETALQALPEDSYLRGFLEGQSGATAAFDVWAYSAGGSDGDPAGFRTVSVATAPSSTVDLAALEPTLKSQFEAMAGVEDVETAMVTLPAGTALRATFTVSAQAGGPKLMTTQYYVPLGDNVAVVTFVANPDASDEFDAIIGSLEATS